MTRNDLRFRFLVEAEAAEELMSADDREFLLRYVPRNAEARAEHEALRRLASLGSEDDERHEDEDDDALVQAVVDLHVATAGPAANDEPPANVVRPGAWRLGVMLAAASLVAFMSAALASTVLRPRAGEGETVASGVSLERVGLTSGKPVEARASTLPWPATAVVVPDAAVEVLSGRFERVDADGRTHVATRLVPGMRMVAASDDACIGSGSEDTLCLERGAAIALSGTAIDVVEGVARATFMPSPHGIRTYRVMVAGNLYEPVLQPEIVTLVIDVRTPQRWEVVVEGGVVRVDDGKGGVEELQAGEARALGFRSERGRSEAMSSAAALLAQARTRRAQGDRRGAIEAYEALVRQHASTPTAKPAMISLGQLHLELGRARAALRWFDRYLARGTGPLDEEALYGRIRAFERLGRYPEEERAIEAFLAKYPSSSYAAGLRRRLP